MASRPALDPIVCIVGFHHARGPEVEAWLGVAEGSDPATENEWPLLPFMALSDGAHAATEDFSYFTLRREAASTSPATSLFGMSCTRQLDANALINRPADVTRSTVQKAVVVISDRPQFFGQLREKLSAVTKAWFAQRDFTDQGILEEFQESLSKQLKDREDERDQYFGLSLRELIHEFKYQTLVLFKCCLLQPKMLFFGSHCERLCMMQFSLISLIPGLIRNLQDSADPAFNSYEENLVMPTSLRTSERASLLSYMGLPLQIFGKGSLFGPYTPLQQLDLLADRDTKSYVVGSTNSLLLSQSERYCDILINLDESLITFSSESLRKCLALTVPDRRWIDFLTQAVNDSWDEANPSRPKTLGYAGSEEFIRLQFEEYLLALLSAVKFRLYSIKKQQPQSSGASNGPIISEIEGDPSAEFNTDFIAAWQRTENFRIFHQFTDSHIFDIVEPTHPCSGGLTIEDVQRRLASQVQELHLDERWRDSREVLGKGIKEGQKRFNTAVEGLWEQMEALREAQRRRAEQQKANASAGLNGQLSSSSGSPSTEKGAIPGNFKFLKGTPDLSQAQATVQAAGSRAGAYFSSWGTWASEKRKTGWGRNVSGTSEKSEKKEVEPPPPPVYLKDYSQLDKKMGDWVGVDLNKAQPEAEKRKESVETVPTPEKAESPKKVEMRIEQPKTSEENAASSKSSPPEEETVTAVGEPVRSPNPWMVGKDEEDDEPEEEPPETPRNPWKEPINEVIEQPKEEREVEQSEQPKGEAREQNETASKDDSEARGRPESRASMQFHARNRTSISSISSERKRPGNKKTSSGLWGADQGLWGAEKGADGKRSSRSSISRASIKRTNSVASNGLWESKSVASTEVDSDDDNDDGGDGGKANGIEEAEEAEEKAPAAESST